MAIQISRVIERSSIWMPSARDVTRNRADYRAVLGRFSRSILPFYSTSFSFRPSSLVVEFVVFLFPVNESIGSTLRSRSISTRRVARAPNGRTLESAYHPEPGLAGREPAREARRRRAAGEKETRNLQLTSLITSCPHAVALLKSASRALGHGSLLATALKLFNCTARYFPTTTWLSRFLCARRASNGLNRLDFRLPAEMNK